MDFRDTQEAQVSSTTLEAPATDTTGSGSTEIRSRPYPVELYELRVVVI